MVGTRRPAMCPIITGATLADRSAQMLDGQGLPPRSHRLSAAARCHRWPGRALSWTRCSPPPGRACGLAVSKTGSASEGNRDDLLLLAQVDTCQLPDLMTCIRTATVAVDARLQHRSRNLQGASMNSPFKPMRRPPPSIARRRRCGLHRQRLAGQISNRGQPPFEDTRSQRCQSGSAVLRIDFLTITNN